MSDQPLISIIIVSWNVRDLVRQCLASIEQYVSYPHQVIVVDNASKDGTVAAIKKEFPQVQVLASSSNLGFAKANNLGLREARGRFVVFLNPDTELIDEPFRAMIDYCRSHPQAGAIGPEILNRDQSHQQSVRNFPKFSDQAITLLKLRRLLRWTRPMRRYLADPGAQRRQPLVVDQIMGAAMLFPASAIIKLGGFDERYWIWFEEVDLCQRLKQQGLQVVYFPGSHIVHHGNQSFGQVLSLKKQRWFMQSLRRYTNQFWPRWQAWLLWPLMGLSYILTAVQMIVKPR